MDLFEQMPDSVVLVILDIGAGRDLASYLRIKGVPHTMNFIDGEPQDNLVGAKVDELVKFFNKTLRRVMSLSD